MSFPQILKQPSTFVAASFVAACALALGATLAGYAVINGATQVLISVSPS